MDYALEQVRCAQINLDNLAKGFPGLSEHVYFKIILAQLKEAEELLSK